MAEKRIRGRLFRKYVGLFMAVVAAALIASGGLQIWFSYQESKDYLIRIQREQAQTAAIRIGQFVHEIEGQLGWTTQLSWSAGGIEQRRFDALRLLRQVPAVTELAQLDAQGREQLRVSRLAMDVIGSQSDLSREPQFTEAVARRVYYGPVTFRRDSEPYMTLAVAGNRRDAGVSVAEVNLKFIWDVVSQIQVGRAGYAYVVDAQGRLIAHPDISRVLRNTDLSGLSQVQAARRAGAAAMAEADMVARDMDGRDVIAAAAAVPATGWMVFVELPLSEALAPILGSAARTGVLLLLGLVIAFLAGLFLARRMVGPIQALQRGAAEIGGGDLTRRIAVKTGDELEALAQQFNDMTGRLQESYAGLERKVAERTQELSESLEQQTATANVLKVISRSTFDLQPVLGALLETAIRLCKADMGLVFRASGGVYRLAAGVGSKPEFLAWLATQSLAPGRGSVVGRVALEGRTVHIPDLLADPEYTFTDAPTRGSFRASLGVPLLRSGVPIGVFSLNRNAPEPFTDKQIELVTTFADQAVIAIENVRLFQEVEARTQELAQSVEELRALGEVSQAVTSTLDLPTVLTTIVAKAVQLSDTEAGAIYVYSQGHQAFRMRASYGTSDALAAEFRRIKIGLGETAIGEAAARREAVQVPDIAAMMPASRIKDLLIAGGYRAILVVPLLRPDQVVGALVIRRKESGEFPKATIELLSTFASQSVLAIQNARLFSEIEEKGRQLALASQHKSQFLANMSHELRTPLNAILGYTELIVDSIYGDVPDKVRGVLERVQSNGRHLLGLINDVLDLSKIEAGQLELTLQDYGVPAMIASVVSATESLARNKGLALRTSVAEGLPAGYGDERRLTQVLLNLVGNAIKFTDQGEIEIAAASDGGRFRIAVRDTGPGIAEADQARIFEEFQQVDNSNTRQKGGTGLGLAISRRIVALHGGTITLESAPGAGSTFTIVVPIRAVAAKEAA